MRRYLKKLGGFVAIQLAIAAAVLVGRPWPGDNYLIALADKEQLARRTQPPRVLLAGGSGVAFGMDSPELARRIDRPVVNLGLHAGLGLPYMTSQAQALARPGDTVVLCFEYEHYTHYAAARELPNATFYNPGQLWRHWTWADLKYWLDHGLNYLGRTARKSQRRLFKPVEHPNPPYTRSSFNAFGDVTAHWAMPDPDTGSIQPSLRYDPAHLADVIDRLNAMAARLERRGVRVCLMLPAYPRRLLDANRHAIQAIQRDLRADLELPLLNSAESAAMDEGMFYDTVYHLNRRGVTARVDRWAPALRAFLTEGGKARRTEPQP